MESWKRNLYVIWVAELVAISGFAVVFPFLPTLEGLPGFVNQVSAILLKILFIFPIAGLAYEVIKFSSKHMDRRLVRLVVLPGLWVQKLTTREPGDEQLEVALAALKNALQGQSGAAEEMA